jgi:DNA-binding NarL/FixJ family response regulator
VAAAVVPGVAEEVAGPAALAEGASPHTACEAEVLSAARGHAAVADLAASLHLSQGTVRNHLSAAIQKLGARNGAEAIQVAERKGLALASLPGPGREEGEDK